MYTNQKLPTQEKINSVKDKVIEEVEKGINQSDKYNSPNSMHVCTKTWLVPVQPKLGGGGLCPSFYVSKEVATEDFRILVDRTIEYDR